MNLDKYVKKDKFDEYLKRDKKEEDKQLFFEKINEE